jgi:hypothetical protein
MKLNRKIESVIVVQLLNMIIESMGAKRLRATLGAGVKAMNYTVPNICTPTFET